MDFVVEVMSEVRKAGVDKLGNDYGTARGNKMTPRTFNNDYRGNNGNFHNMIFLSLVIHLIVITVILISIPTYSRHLTFGQAYPFNL